MLDDKKPAGRYEPEKIDVENPNVCYAIELKLIGNNKTVLEVGPATGYITRILKDMGNEVYCVEIDEEAAKIAEKYCDGLIVGDVEELNFDDYFKPEQFDVILFSDVLEHLKWPGRVLKKVKKYLKPDGYIVASIPNIAHGDVILNLISGRFNYRSMGLLDETHLRFFTIDGILRMFRESGYKVTEVYTTKVEIGYSELGDVVKKVPQPIINFIRKLPHSNVYQFVIKAHKAEYPAEEVNMEEISISSIPIEEIVELQRRMQEYDREIRELRFSLEYKEERIKELQENLQRLSAEAHQKGNMVAELEKALKIKDGELNRLQQEIESLRSAVRDREAEIERLNDELERISGELESERERVSALTKSLEEKTKELNEFKVKSINLEQKIRGLEGELKEKESLVGKLRRELDEKEKMIGELQQESQKVKSELAAKDEQIKSLTEENIRFSQELESMKSSVTWRAVMKWHSFVERVAPLGTRRRRWYDLGVKGLRVLASSGFRGLWRSASEYRKQRKLEEMQIETKDIYCTSSYTSFNTADVSELEFPNFENPEVSIVIPVYNNAELTYNCLKSILSNTAGCSYEVILVDDASTEKEVDTLFDKIKNVKIIRNKENVGFVESCNIGAKASSGKYILFLNNDTIVTPGWLPPLLEFIKREDVGAVGAKLVYPDGKLQEAGGIIWKDASGWNYGRYDDPERPEYNFVREVDYCSGAALMVKKEIFEKIGGFDGRFKPAYYEDTDLCFSIRKMGYKVMYQPKSVIIHLEGATCGTDTSSGIKKFQEINRQKFYEKWKDTLLKHHYNPDPSNLFLARCRTGGKRILVIDHYVPTFDKDSGSYRMYNILKILIELGHCVTFIGDNLAKMEPYTSILQQIGIEVLYGPYTRSIEDYLKDHGKFFDIVILSRAPIAEKHILAVRKYCSKAKIIFDTVDLHFLREMRRAELEKNDKFRELAEKLKNIELKLARLANLTLVVSPFEKELLLREDPTLNVEVLSNIHEIKPPKNSFENRKDIMFLGGFAHPPNIDAVKWFINDIFPKIKQQLPEVKFIIVGSNPPEEIMSLSSDDIIVTGYVRELEPYFESVRVFVSPLRYGAGVKGKINMAMSHGLPVVTTSIGAEGMNLVDGENALIADDPETFAEKVIRLYTDKDLWEKLSKNSIEHTKKYFSYETAKKKVAEILNCLFSNEKKHFEGFCTVCGERTFFVKTQENLRETFVCKRCGSISRNRHLAKVMCQVLGKGNTNINSLKDLVRHLPELKVYEAQASGPIHSVLKELKGYVCSEYFPDTPSGSYKGSILCQDLQNLSFPDESFDVVITQDVLEHVKDPFAAFREIHRVLKPCGYHIFTIPYSPKSKTVRRVIVKDGREIYVLPKAYHKDTDVSDCLVYTDFGYDIIDILKSYGFETNIIYSNEEDERENCIYWSVVFISQKIAELKEEEI